MKEQYFNIPAGESKLAPQTKYYVLVIYDIIDNKKRTKLAKFLNSFGFRIQKSAFEAIMTRQNYDKLMRGIARQINDKDDVRVYKIRGTGAVTIFGAGELVSDDDVIVL